MGRLLVLGGTRFLSWTVAATAVARGHEVVCAARGTSGAVPAGCLLVEVDRDRPGALDPLRGERFDAVVDVARMSLPWVRAALAAVTAAHWTFVSTISVYADSATLGQGVDAPLLDADPAGDYGAVKVASEEAVRAAVGDRALIVRAGLVCGPGDLSDRFGYWPARLHRGGRAVVPDQSGQPAQIVDVRDLAGFVAEAGEASLTGTFDGVGPRSTLHAVLGEIADAVGAPDLERVPVAPAVLVGAGVAPWAGPALAAAVAARVGLGADGPRPRSGRGGRPAQPPDRRHRPRRTGVRALPGPGPPSPGRPHATGRSRRARPACPSSQRRSAG